MKTKDIVIGDDYEVGEGSYTRRAKVLEVGTFKKQVYSSSRSFTSHTTEMKGARVAYWSYDGKTCNEEHADWVRTQAIKRPWKEAAESRARAAASEKAMDQVAAELNEQFTRLGIDLKSYYSVSDHTAGFKVYSLYTKTMRQLIEALKQVDHLDD